MASTSSLNRPRAPVSAITAAVIVGEKLTTMTTSSAHHRELGEAGCASGAIGSHGQASQATREQAGAWRRRASSRSSGAMPRTRRPSRSKLSVSPAMSAISVVAMPVITWSCRGHRLGDDVARYGPIEQAEQQVAGQPRQVEPAQDVAGDPRAEQREAERQRRAGRSRRRAGLAKRRTQSNGADRQHERRRAASSLLPPERVATRQQFSDERWCRGRRQSSSRRALGRAGARRRSVRTRRRQRRAAAAYRPAPRPAAAGDAARRSKPDASLPAVIRATYTPPRAQPRRRTANFAPATSSRAPRADAAGMRGRGVSRWSRRGRRRASRPGHQADKQR